MSYRGSAARAVQLGFAPPPRREVELVRAQRELRRAAEIGRGQRCGHDLQVEAVEEVAERQRAGAQLLPFELLFVELRAALVLGGRLTRIELPRVPQQRDGSCRLVRPLEREHLRAVAADVRALDRVVVDEDERVEADVQPCASSLRFSDFGRQLIAAATI